MLIKHRIGNGSQTSFWWDNWTTIGPLNFRFPHTLLTEAGFNDGTTANSFIVDNTWSFPLSLTSAIPELLSLPPPCPSRNDSKKWIASPNGQYSFKHTLQHLIGDLSSVQWHNLVWDSPIIPRMRFNLWMAVQSRLPTLDNKAMARHQNICALCNNSTESHDHLFFNCSFISPIWRFITYKCQLVIPTANWEVLVLQISNNWKSNTPSNMLRKLALSSVVYHTWEERNARIYKGEKSSQRVVCSKICSTISAILKLRVLRNCSTTSKILKDWNLSPSCCRPPLRPPPRLRD
ncbi:uncharacterized protein LOC132314116 [Cornus florida]|uniref:uncharacterized protein LOC132314116 n=1 Tax=Cornus florida TaxID=4283 RepID=UPI00289E6289|nr:uncharacterized protein LOC132314116 [Cornus florida]